MSTAALAFASVGTWQAEMYDALGQSMRLLEALQRERNALRIAWPIFRINSNLEAMLQGVDDILSGRVVIEAATVTFAEIRPDLIETAKNLDKLHLMLDMLISGAKHSGFFNSSFSGFQFRNLEKHSERLCDLAVWLDELARPEEYEAKFAKGEAEFERGEFEELADVLR